MRRLLLGSVFSALVFGATANAEPVTYACAVAEANPLLADVAKYDQIVVNSETQTIEFWEANTRGTSAPKSLQIDGRGEYLGSKFAYLETEDFISASVLMELGVASVSIMKGMSVAYSYVTPAGGGMVRWNCKE